MSPKIVDKEKRKREIALAALEKLVERGEIGSGESVVVISTAHGLKFPQFKIDYHWGKPEYLSGETARYANPPVELPADYDAVVSAIFQHVRK